MENKLKYFRNKKGLSQEYVADKLYVTRQTIYNWEKKDNMPPLIALRDLSKIYNVPISYLINEGEITMGRKKINFISLIGIIMFNIIFIPSIFFVIALILFVGWAITLSFLISPILVFIMYITNQGFSWIQLGSSILLMIAGIPLSYLMYIITKFSVKSMISYFKYNFKSIFYKKDYK